MTFSTPFSVGCVLSIPEKDQDGSIVPDLVEMNGQFGEFGMSCVHRDFIMINAYWEYQHAHALQDGDDGDGEGECEDEGAGKDVDVGETQQQ